MMLCDMSGISPDLIALPRWVCWSLEDRNSKPTKVPRSGRAGHVIDATAPACWVRYDQAAEYAARKGLGVGIALGDGLAGIDLDKCRDPQTGSIAAWAVAIIRTFATYTEVSPSGTGIKLFFWARLEKGRRRGPVECYGSKRFFTVTGAHLDHTPTTIEPRQRELDALLARLFPPEAPTERRTSGASTLADHELIERAMRARNGERFRRLWAGDWQALGYGSQWWRKEGRSGEFDELLDTWHIYRPFPIPLLCLAVHASITGRPSPRDRPRHRTPQDLPL